MTYRPKAVTIDDRAVEHLVAFCRDNALDKLFLVADTNTYEAQGRAVADALRAGGFDLKQLLSDMTLSQAFRYVDDPTVADEGDQ